MQPSIFKEIILDFRILQSLEEVIDDDMVSERDVSRLVYSKYIKFVNIAKGPKEEAEGWLPRQLPTSCCLWPSGEEEGSSDVLLHQGDYKVLHLKLCIQLK